MRQLAALVQKEWLKHRRTVLLTLVFALCIIGFSSSPGSFSVEKDGVKISIDQLDDLQKISRFYTHLQFYPMTLIYIFILMTAFYLAKTFYYERMDNTILFYRSLPVSEYLVVFSKLFCGVAFVVIMSFIVLLCADYAIYYQYLHYFNTLKDPALEQQFSVVSMIPHAAMGMKDCLLILINYLPGFAILLLISALAVKAPFLGAIILLSVLQLISDYFHQTWLVFSLFPLNTFFHLIPLETAGFFSINTCLSIVLTVFFYGMTVKAYQKVKAS